MRRTRRFVVVSCALGMGGIGAPLLGGPVPPPASVPGKEYSNFMDHDMLGPFLPGVPDPHQNLWWDGAGLALDTFDYTGSGSLDFGREVDALANVRDALYMEVSHFDAVPMLTSFTAVPDIYFTMPVGPPHAPNGIWAPAPIINAALPPTDVDGLEVWGPPGPGGDDANFASLSGDPAGIAVHSYDPIAHASAPYLTDFAIATAIGHPELEQQIDLDAMMIFDTDDALGSAASFGPGDSIMFSIAPVTGPAGVAFDGGEIWVWDFGAPAFFLFHGGEFWDTPHDVTGHFFPALAGTGLFENINALEAVPAPGAIVLIGLGAMVSLRRRRSA